MAWLRTIVGAILLLPSVGCTLCCSPFDNCGPLCNGECCSGCCTTARSGGYSGETVYYEDSSPGPRLAPTPAQPRQAPRLAPLQAPVQEIEPPVDTTAPEQPYDTFEPSDAGIPESTETLPESTTPETEQFPATDPNEQMPPFDEAFPPTTDTPADDAGVPASE